MPTITITQDQADALAAGKPLVIEPAAPKPKMRRYVVLFETGNAFEIETTQFVPTHDARCELNLVGRCRLISSWGSHSDSPGAVQISVRGVGTAVEVCS